MTENQKNNTSKTGQPSEYYMRSDIIDQSNIIHQSNMALSLFSVITQSYSSVKINNIESDEGEEYEDE